MTGWLHFWVYPLGLLGGVALVSLNSLLGVLLAMTWAFVLVPHIGRWILLHSRHGAGDRHGVHAVDTDYWRTRL